MNKTFRTLALCVALAFAATMMACAAKKPVKKPVAKKPPVASTHKETVGTTQLKGEYAEFGTTYTLGKTDPLNINVKSAEYSVEALKIGENTWVPNADQKILILHMTYHNPRPQDSFIRYDSFKFTVVDPKNENHEGNLDLGGEKDGSTIALSLKPAQKLDVFTAMLVPAEGEMPKLIIEGSDNLVLRYDLRGKVKGLQPPFVDPKDKSGATALARIDAKFDTYYPVANLHVRMDTVEYSDATQIGENERSEDDHYMIMTLTAKNVAAQKEFMRFDTFTVGLVDEDGVEIGSCVDMFQKSKDRSFSGDVQPGQEMTVRLVYTMPKDTKAKSLGLSHEEKRTFFYDLSSVE